MQTNQKATTPANCFELKNVMVDLIAPPASSAACLSIGELESFRVQRRAVPASKHGLEVLCGASCETAAQ